MLNIIEKNFEKKWKIRFLYQATKVNNGSFTKCIVFTNGIREIMVKYIGNVFSQDEDVAYGNVKPV